MTVDITFHYPPELMNLLIDVIPLLNRSKKDVFLFFKGAGISDKLVSLVYQQWNENPESINKFEIVRQILTKLNERGETCLRERREVLKRVVEFENFSVCWEQDQLKAKGLVADICKVVNVKDSFTLMNIERERERKQRFEKAESERATIRRRQDAIAKVKKDLFELFSIATPQTRGKLLEDVLNRLFKAFDISIREAFSIVSDSSKGILEQIDGVIELDGHIYFVEMKWWNSPLGVPEVSHHLVRVYQRAEGRDGLSSGLGFYNTAVETCKRSSCSKKLSFFVRYKKL